MAELGLRFRPSNEADLAAHAERIRLLTEDLADVPVNLLRAAAKQWSLSKAFLPKASELRNLAEVISVAEQRSHRSGHGGSAADRANARLAADGKPPMWAMNNGVCEFVGPPSTARPPAPFSRDELQAMVDASGSSILAHNFKMGLTSGFIIDLGGGRYQERGGAFSVMRSAPSDHYQAA